MTNNRMNIERFQRIINNYHKKDSKAIGTLSEKTLHAILKEYLEENQLYHEVKVENFYADICKDNNIIEIQTRSLNKLRPKLDIFLKKYDVTICYPINHIKYLEWIDCETGEVSARRKSPKVGKIADMFYELYKIKMYINNPHFHFKVLLVDVVEYRNLDGWSENKKRGSSRYERIPLNLVEEVNFDVIADYSVFLEGLDEEFTNEDFAKHQKINIRYASIGTNILCSLGLIEKYKKAGRKIVYKKTRS